VFTTVKYGRGLALKDRYTHFWGSKAGKGLRGIDGCWCLNSINPEKCLLTQELSALPANPTPTSEKAIAA
jgi:hypothetical protein